MNDLVYPYNKALHSRLFLNCYQRQSMVMLAETRSELHLLFFRCLISTDDIVEQIIENQREKYDFESRFFEPDDLLRIGIVKEDHLVETYAEAKQLLVDIVAAQRYVIPVVDVFYMKHRRLYRHIVHTITLKEYDAAAGVWSIVDDNPACVLCRYNYPEELIAAAYDNNTLRRVRYFTHVPYDPAEAIREASRQFDELLGAYRDSCRLLDGIGDLLACRWIAPKRIMALLHDAFSVYQGSRTCLLEYVTRTAPNPAVEAAIGRSLEQAAKIAGMLIVGQVTGSVDVKAMTTTCASLKAAEEEMVGELQSTAATSMSHGSRH